MPKCMPSRYEYLQLLASKITNELVVTNVAHVGFEWHQLKPQEGNLYGVSMSLCTSVALGIALALPQRRVVALDGDGSILMGLHVLPVIAEQNPSNLVVIVFDNEALADLGPSLTAGPADLAKIAQGAGITNVRLVKQLPEFQEAIDETFRTSGTSFIVVKVEVPTNPVAAPPIAIDNIEQKYRFVRHIEKTENLQIIKPPRF